MTRVLQSDTISIVVSRSAVDDNVSTTLPLPDGSSVTVSPATLPDNATTTFDTHVVFWAVNPYATADTASSLAMNVSSVTLTHSDGSGAVIPVSNATTPVVVSLVVPGGTDVTQFRCSYWSEVEGGWSDVGTVLVGYTRLRGTDGRFVAHCATTHLSDFAAVKASVSFIVVTNVNPIDDAGLVAQVLNPQNLLALGVIAGLVVVFVASWVVSYKHDEARSVELGALHRAHMVLFGEVRSGLGMHCLHLPVGHPRRLSVVAMVDDLKVRGGGQVQ